MVSSGKHDPTMAQAQYVVVRQDDEAYQIDRIDAAGARTVALIRRAQDKAKRIEGWRLVPLVAMHGPTRRVWPTAADVAASTRLFSGKGAAAAVKAADDRRTAAARAR